MPLVFLERFMTSVTEVDMFCTKLTIVSHNKSKGDYMLGISGKTNKTKNTRKIPHKAEIYKICIVFEPTLSLGYFFHSLSC